MGLSVLPRIVWIARLLEGRLCLGHPADFCWCLGPPHTDPIHQAVTAVLDTSVLPASVVVHSVGDKLWIEIDPQTFVPVEQSRIGPIQEALTAALAAHAEQ